MNRTISLLAVAAVTLGSIACGPGSARGDWSVFHPATSPSPPRVADGAWCGNPVDAFIHARLKKSGLAPAPLVGRRVWIRRVTFDLVGLPPTPDEVRAFLADDRPDPAAYSAVVDRLLASPQYGERWARHWLDVVRYGDSDGFAIDGERPTLWRYRDYVIRALNEDRPFDQFIREQLAGDELELGSEGIVATGFYRLGPWEADNMVRERRRQDFLNEITSAVGSVFLGLTVGCARCHDHKYDPISQVDFYRLQAFFTPLKRSQVKADFLTAESAAVSGRGKANVEAELAQRRKALEEIRASLKQKLAAANSGDAADVTDEQLEQALLVQQKPLTAEDRQKYNRLKGDVNRFKGLERYSAVACTIENPKQDAAVPPTHVLLSGDVFNPGDRVEPGFLSEVTSWSDSLTGRLAEAGEAAAGRRRILAEWLTSPENPITARVMVNRLWQNHMGAGIVASANDFGTNGSGPSHPELLDFLAGRLIEEGWRLKPLHRLLVLSSTYRMSSSHPDRSACMKVDADNRLLWRASYRRLEGEAVRDALLAVSGRLNLKQGGPGFFEKLPEQMGSTFPFFTWSVSDARERRRRSIYMFQRRNMVHPMMEVFDSAEMSESCEGRKASVTAPQALTLLNSNFSQEASRHLAERLLAEAPRQPEKQIERLFWLAFSRPPDAGELRACLQFIADRLAGHESPDEDSDASPETANRQALRDLCLAVINANEFIYLD